jgi:hypothetical protein
VTGQLRRRFWIEAALALLSAFFLLLTVLWQDWIEIVFGVDPDHYSGSLERTIVVVLIAMTVTTIALAGREWRRRVAVTA